MAGLTNPDMSMWDSTTPEDIEFHLFGSELGALFTDWRSQGVGNAQAQADPAFDTQLFPFEVKQEQRTITTDVGPVMPVDGQQYSHMRVGSSTFTASGSADSTSADKNSAESASSYRSHSSSDYWSFSNANSGEVPGYHMLASASVGHGSGWQSLLHDLEPPPVFNAPGKRGRRPSQGVTARKPVKDKKRENSQLIKQLEAEMVSKLNIVKELEGQNTELKRKERLLQLSVDTSEHNMSRLVDPQLDNTLKQMLQSFRGQYNRTTAERVLAKIAHVKEPKDLTFEIFSTCWQALVMEMCDSLMAEATAASAAARKEAEDYLQAMYENVIDFITALCVHHRALLLQAQHRNLVTGEPMDIDHRFWDAVVEKMDLSQEQIRDLVGAYDMYQRCNERNLRERAKIKEELASAIAAQSEAMQAVIGDQGLFSCDQAAMVQAASDHLNANLLRSSTLDTLLAFLTLRMFDAKQAAKMAMHTSPTFPSPLNILLAVRKKAVAEGLAKSDMEAMNMHSPPTSKFGDGLPTQVQ